MTQKWRCRRLVQYRAQEIAKDENSSAPAKIMVFKIINEARRQCDTVEYGEYIMYITTVTIGGRVRAGLYRNCFKYSDHKVSGGHFQ
jgi:hypothetical protein